MLELRVFNASWADGTHFYGLFGWFLHLATIWCLPTRVESHGATRPRDVSRVVVLAHPRSLARQLPGVLSRPKKAHILTYVTVGHSLGCALPTVPLLQMFPTS